MVITKEFIEAQVKLSDVVKNEAKAKNVNPQGELLIFEHAFTEGHTQEYRNSNFILSVKKDVLVAKSIIEQRLPSSAKPLKDDAHLQGLSLGAAFGALELSAKFNQPLLSRQALGVIEIVIANCPNFLLIIEHALKNWISQIQSPTIKLELEKILKNI